MSGDIAERAAERVLAAMADAYCITGDSRYRVAAGIVRGEKPGRKTIDDTGSIAAVAEMLSCGMGKSVDHAAQLVARGLTGEQSVDAAARRIARKYRMKLDLSVPSAAVAA